MFYIVEVEDYVRVEPRLFGFKTSDAVAKQLQETYNDYHDKEIGEVIGVISVLEVGDGIIIPGDGAAYYKSMFKLLVWKPELQELVYGVIDEITNFGAFLNLGVMKGIIHISQTMDDYVSFSKDKSLSGKETKRVLRANDICKARIIAVSFKDALNPKLGLTMRQSGLGRIDWIEEDNKEKVDRVQPKEKGTEEKGKQKKKY